MARSDGVDNISSFEFPLDDGIDLSKITTTGSTFRIDRNELEDIPDHYVDVTPCDMADLMLRFSTDDFAKSAAEMVDVLENGLVKKKILSSGGGHRVPKTSTVKAYYAGFWEGEKHPFDWKLVRRPQIFLLGCQEVLPGLEEAIYSMEIGEQSIFLLSYQLMYGEKGCPPRIKSKEISLFYIHLLGLADKKMKKESDEWTFTWSYKLATQHHKIAKDLFEKESYSYAAKSFVKAAEVLKQSRLANEAENQKQKIFLRKIYRNLAICYNKMKLPKKTCLMCNELQYLDGLWNDPKALFQNARALIMIEEYLEANKRLKKALVLKPKDKEIIDEHNKLEELMKKTERQNNISIAFETKNKTVVSEDFIEEVKKLCEDFSKDPDQSSLSLPPGLSEAELDVVHKIAGEYGYIFDKEIVEVNRTPARI